MLIGDNFAKVKVADFGLSLSRNDEMGVASKYVGSAQWRWVYNDAFADLRTHLRSATEGVRAPEATSSYYTTKCDVYSYGILLWVSEISMNFLVH